MKNLIVARLRYQVMHTPTLLTISVGILLVIYQLVSGEIPLLVQIVFCGGLLLVAGIPHGALDHLVEQERATRQGRPFSLLRFLINYLFTMGIYGAGWILAPVPCLLVFLLISAWHFGETDLDNAPVTAYWSLARLSSGGFVLAFILLTHATETTPILSRIVQQDKLTLLIWQGAVEQLGAVLRGWATLQAVLLMLAYAHSPASIDIWRMTRLSLIVALAFYLPLLPAFMLYFGGWHALSSFHAIREYLPAKTKNPLEASWQVWQKSLPLTGAAFGFLGFLALCWYFMIPATDPLPVMFILLSLITLPHIGVMHAIKSK